ncbi:GlsB/YeaQ/YmgE family stress response membrane protein [bacterium]|nr:MAG: GlsB/YeaQ/YmgE family stress response membrane protein [bacterium]
MHLIGSLIIGVIAGAVAKLLMPGKDPGGFFVTMGLGVLGALLATFLGRAVGWYQEGEGAGFIAAVVGAIVILAIYRMIKGRRTTV